VDVPVARLFFIARKGSKNALNAQALHAKLAQQSAAFAHVG